MTRRRKSERGDGSFSNRPYSSTQGMPAKPALLQHHRPQMTVPGGETDASDLFLRSVGEVRRISKGDERGKKESAPQFLQDPGHSAPPIDADRTVFLEAMRSMGTTISRERVAEEDEEPEERGRSRSDRLRALKKGTLRIAEELDLHGCQRHEALQKLGHFVAAACARGRRAVLVITGKGINSLEGPVLPGAVASWLREQGKEWVAEFHPAPREKGGGGAFVVFLRQK